MNSHELFTNTPPRKLFFFAALPGAVSMLASALYQLFDGMSASFSAARRSRR